MKKPRKPQETNYFIERADHKERFEVITNYHLYDSRLTLAEKGLLTLLFILPKEWKITQRATSSYLNIDKSTFNRYIKNLIEYGYIELVKTKNNRTLYKLKEKPQVADFKPSSIEYYTISQLNAYLNDERIEQRYKELIKKALNQAHETRQEFNKLIAELEQETTETDKDDELPF